MDYRDYRKKYAPVTPAKTEIKDDGPRADRAAESATGSVTRHFDTERGQKKRYSGNAKNTASAKIVLGAIIALTFILILVTVLLIVTNTGTGTKLPSYLYDKIVVEAGRTSISAADFLDGDAHTAAFADGTEYSLDKVGSYPVRVVIDGGDSYVCTVEVRDTVAPAAEGVDISVRAGSSLEASDCVKNVKDATEVSISFKKAPDMSKAGTYSVIVLLRDGGGNETEINSTVRVAEAGPVLNYTVTVEAGSAVPDVTAFVGVGGSGEYYTDISTVNMSVPGIYSPEIEIEGKRYTVHINVVDTVKPTAKITPVTVYRTGAFPEAKDFVSEINDATAVTVSYAEEPVNNGTFPVNVKIKLTDLGGNYTIYESTVSADIDETAPVIEVYNDELELTVGEALVWRANIKVTDNHDAEPEVSLDLCGADTSVAGTYKVYYVAKDAAGNESRSLATLYVRSVDFTEEKYTAAVKKLVDSLELTGKTAMEQMRALWVWGCYNDYNHLKYINDSDHDDWKLEAYKALTDHQGDCFASASVAQAVFRYLGYDTVMVERAEAGRDIGTHFWIMINLGTEAVPAWYHFDCTCVRDDVRVEAYALTTDQLKAYTKWRAERLPSGALHFYDFDESAYPQSATEIIHVLTRVNYAFTVLGTIPDSYLGG